MRQPRLPFYIRAASHLFIPQPAVCCILISLPGNTSSLYTYIVSFSTGGFLPVFPVIYNLKGNTPLLFPLPLSRIHSCRHRFGFIRCKGLLSRLIRQLEVHFLQILPPQVERNWQEKPSYKAVPTAVYRIHKTPKRFRQEKNRTEGKEKNNH